MSLNDLFHIRKKEINSAQFTKDVGSNQNLNVSNLYLWSEVVDFPQVQGTREYQEAGYMRCICFVIEKNTDTYNEYLSWHLSTICMYMLWVKLE